jgi:hypothetical protein
MRSASLLLALVLTACGTTTTHEDDSGVDAGRDAGSAAMDSGHDAGSSDSGGIDAGVDAGTDAGPTCACSTGACCDGCNFRPNSYVCATNVVRSVSCAGVSVCMMGIGDILVTTYADRRCPGGGAACTGTYGIESHVDVDCDSSQGFPTYARCVDPGSNGAYCTWGPNCSTEHP